MKLLRDGNTMAETTTAAKRRSSRQASNARRWAARNTPPLENKTFAEFRCQ
jgi:hypothetical protein